MRARAAVIAGVTRRALRIRVRGARNRSARPAVGDRVARRAGLAIITDVTITARTVRNAAASSKSRRTIGDRRT